MLSVWLLGCFAIFVDSVLMREPRLQLHQLRSQHFGELAIPPVTDGQGGLCLQGRDGQLHRINPDGSPTWSITVPGHFELQSIQSGDGFLVLTGRWGQALAINADGSERWRFEPVHHEQASDLAKRRGSAARFYTMSTALIYGLDERGVQQWVRRMSSATSMASQRPFMWIDPDGNLITRCNYGKLRASPTGELLVLRGPDVWEMEIMDTDAAGRILEYGNGGVYISDGNGTQIFDGSGLMLIPGSEFAEFSPELSGAWLTSEGFALLNNGNYVRFDRVGGELREDYRAGQPLGSVALGDEQLRLLRQTSSFSRLPLFIDTLLSGFGGEIPDQQMYPVDTAGRSELLLELAGLSLPVAVPGWLEHGNYEIHALGSEHLLCIDHSGLGRICWLSGGTGR
jgi:outer membrane protein assembly factor BamB